MNDDVSSIERLRADADALCADPRLRELLRRHWPGFFRRPAQRPLSTRIHAEDQMLLHSLRHHRDPNAAVSQYFNVALQQHFAARQIVDALFPPARGRIEVLDFACGFGRLLRFLGCGDRELGLAAAEIQDDALQFVAQEFGIETLPSNMTPEAFDPGRRFDIIWVASLFSHLPQGLFHRWLARLHSLLTPAGVLCFSVHDEALVPPGEQLSAGGLLFKPQSENAALDAEAYGTTYVSENFVRAALASSVGSGLPCHRIRKGLAHEQDIYVVAAGREPELGALAGFRRGPWGWVDERRVDDDGTLVLSGWAASLDDGALPAVSVRIDGVAHDCPTGLPRTDVRDAFADDRLAGAGWAFRQALAAPAAGCWVEVTAHTPRGECALLYAGQPGGRRPALALAAACAMSPPGRPEGEERRAQPEDTPANTEEESVHVYRRDIDMGVRSSLSILANLVAPGSRVLDLGTGSGALGRHLQEAGGCRVDGVTLSVDEQAAARPWYDRLERLNLEDPAWPQRFADRCYDYIVCADVLEHLREPERVLQACRALLRPDGWLLVSVPNVGYAGMIASLMLGDWRYGAEGLLDRTHLRFYTRRSFQRLLEAEGWQVDRIEAIDHSWYYTEFWTPIDQLPPAVARFLLAQPDAATYQLVFAAHAAPAAARALPAAVPRYDPMVDVAVYTAALYLGGADGTGLARGIHVLGRVGAEAQMLTFDIAVAPSGPPALLRWHPADRPGFMRVRSMVLCDARGQALWQWRAEAEGAAALAGCHRHAIEFGATAPGAPFVVMALLGEEPQIDLPVPAAALAGSVGPWRLAVVCDWPWSADYLAVRELLRPSATPPASATPPNDPCVEIVLPVYGNLDIVRSCVHSVLGAACRQPWHLTIIDDASPQPEVGRWLREFALLHPEVTVIANARNLGFVATVNLGMRLAGRRDVVLLNSDTEVANDWLDRLVRALRAEPNVGTVTPFSNNATICSYPRYCEDNPLPPGWTPAALDRLFARANGCLTTDIPTAIGFCMLVRRDCLDQVGDFDEQTFGAGYGEENDFCLRATARGWRHLHALDVFVYHAGAASFSERRHELQRSALAAIGRLYPHYEALVQAYVQRDPARPYREAVERLQAAAASPTPSMGVTAGPP